jgi:ABC-type multidrug transport system ATPase subunit
MNGAATPVIEAAGLWRSHGRRRKRVDAVRGVSFQAGRGEIFGLIGPDGAGKTSVIQMLAGVLEIHKGCAKVDGIDVAADPETVKEHVGYMPQGLGVNLYESLTAAENIEFFRDLRKLPEDLYQRNRTELLTVTRLAPFVHRRARELSGGMRQKLALICALIHLPDVLLLDEPTTGVDPISRQDFWQIIWHIVQERKVTVLLSTSYMDEAERCHRIGLMHAGELIRQGDPEDLKATVSGRYARIVATPQREAVKMLQRRSDVLSTEVFGQEIRIRLAGNLDVIESELVSEGIQVREAEERRPGLEDLFAQLLVSGKQEKASLGTRPQRLAVSAMVQSHAATRRFGNFAAVDSVDLTIERGEIFGLLGPNGAGKTTLIKMMCGLLEPTSGAIRVAGFDIKSQKEMVWPRIGYMSQQFSLYGDLTVMQNLRLHSDLYNVTSPRFVEMTESLGLATYKSHLARDLPPGLRQRLSLLCAVLHGPPVLFLDEPTSGVDPVARRTFWDLIYELSRESGVTVLVSTHYMDEAGHCDRLGLMDRGRLVAVDTPENLKSTSEKRSGRLLAVHTHDFGHAFDVVRSAFPDAFLYGDRVHLRSTHPDYDREKLQELLLAREVADAVISEPPLSMDEAFIDFIRCAEEAVHA